MLVSVGSCLFTLTSAYGFHDFLVNGGAVIRADPARIAAQIVTGIGFLGAGAIIRQGLAIRGLTTAATLWVVAAIGLAVGSGYYSAGLITTLVVLFSLWPLRILAYRFFERPHERRLSVELGRAGSPAGVIETLEQLGVHVEQFEVEEAEGVRSLELRVDLPRGVPPELVIRRLLMVEQVQMARWGP
jgi:putative Mg2+ transporter-C (MgtC) family protein